jgi:porin
MDERRRAGRLLASCAAAWMLFEPAGAAAQGLEFSPSFRFTGYADTALEGSTDDDTRFSGRLDAFLAVRNIWPGGSLNAQLEYVDGDPFIGLGSAGVFWPTNVHSAVPRRVSVNNAGLSLTFTHRFSESQSLTFGKFNVVELADGTPLVGGRGKGGFLYTGIAAPPSFVFPPYVLGVNYAQSTERVNYSLLVYDAQNASGEGYWDDPFSDGITVNGTATYKAQFGGLPGFYSVNLVYSTEDATDFTELNDDVEDGSLFAAHAGRGFAALKFQQYLFQNPRDAEQGWGIFRQVGFGGDSNPLDNQFLLGIGGNPPIAGRGDDRWGLAWSRFNWSDGYVLQRQADGGDLQDEWGVETFYEAAVTETFRIGANAMYVRPGDPAAEDLVQVGLRVRATF